MQVIQLTLVVPTHCAVKLMLSMLDNEWSQRRDVISRGHHITTRALCAQHMRMQCRLSPLKLD